MKAWKLKESNLESEPLKGVYWVKPLSKSDLKRHGVDMYTLPGVTEVANIIRHENVLTELSGNSDNSKVITTNSDKEKGAQGYNFEGLVFLIRFLGMLLMVLIVVYYITQS